MVQTDSTLPLFAIRLGRILGVLLGVLFFFGTSSAPAFDRTTLLVPLPHDAAAASPPATQYPDDALGDFAGDPWRGYLQIWKAHHQDPTDPVIRRFLGLPLKSSLDVRAVRGRSSPRLLRWKPGSFAQVDTPHFVIYSHATREPSVRLAEDLERCYWVWTQLFFPLWESSAQVAAALKDWSVDQPIVEYLRDNSARISQRRKLRVVLFRDAAEYQQTLSAENPGIERSTGFYDNGRQTVFLYADDNEDAATRRHELVHQLFREATRSALGRSLPGDDEGFWLIEGIAGYFESLFFADRIATVGGWDSPRLQFARYRMLVGGDTMPMQQLRADGRLAAQKRQDLARWYAHAIARTHQFMDAGNVDARLWIYQQLAKRYRVRTDLPKSVVDRAPDEWDRGLNRFLSIDDAHLAANPVRRPLRQLVLAGCEISEQGLESIPASPQLQWLDCARLNLGNDGIRRLAPNPASIEQLTLEVTRIDEGLNDWFGQAKNLTELDLSFTRAGDETIRAIAGAQQLTVLWMTGTPLTDRSIEIISQFRNLESVDLQRTKVTSEGLARLRRALPKVQINPLQLR